MLLFACIGLLFTTVFVGMQFGLFNVRGSIDARNSSILTATTSPAHTSLMALIMNLVPASPPAGDTSCTGGQATCAWPETREWAVVAGGLAKDLPLIERVAAETGVSPRTIAAVVVPEQLRFFTSEREVFKRYFEPLKILGSLSKFSLGVSGIKQETAQVIEDHANDPASPYYHGPEAAHLLAYDPAANHDEVLFNRLTDEKDHYYSYLYTALFIKEIMAQWKRAGYDLSGRPDIVATIFNIGFGGSLPHVDPTVGGSLITVGGVDYTFGSLAGAFYRSGELAWLRP
ncbi:hypothetical protein COU19_02945 [Candidatus Kaiserbacteria bacterium CG10_big_fil_rev_8_21_14_0_10_56_12]|uniref:Uncharacterized protein n=1 Tax=Candidatus Kaiserbacteria bacterium CG10_big_fil_rev_8_21_14_0_10_56_12 TaxID=1974611 RepID=A0A2H0UBC6_9BACT|nr:MAG: hypothetical protein COU19_02945 [Candidatus Kaiserbacteria bacterium CG10_big_fil_rev_8_21_14_0_10_56_12]